MNRTMPALAILFYLDVAIAGPEPTLSIQVDGCAATKTGMVLQARSPWTTTDPKIEVVGGGIRYSRAGQHQCCRKVEILKQVQKGKIVLTEYWTGEGCRCVCFSQIEATLTKLVSGDYEVTVYSGGIETTTHTNIEPKTLLSQMVKIP